MKKKNNISDNTIIDINIEDILTREANPRKTFNDDDINELAQSIKQVGIIQPITVIKAVNTEKMYAIVAGERRYRAAKIAELKTIPCYIKEYSQDEIINISLTENIQRKDMTETETAQAIKSLYDEKKLSFQDIADKLGKSIKYVKDRYFLNSLIPELGELLNGNILTTTKCIVLAFYSRDIQQEMFEKHFKEDDYSSWRGYSAKKIQDVMERNYNASLDKAVFDKTPCKKCSFNSALTHLFEQDNAICLDFKCYKRMTNDFILQSAIDAIDENPHYPIFKAYYSSDFLLKQLAEKEYEVFDEKFEEFPEVPNDEDAPQEPDTAEMDEEEKEEALNDYNRELYDFNSEKEEAIQERNEIEENINKGLFAYCFIIGRNKIEKGYFKISDDTEETVIEDENIIQTLKYSKEIETLKKKFAREEEIKTEKAITDIKESIIKDDFVSDADLLQLESDMFYFYIYQSLPYDRKEKLFTDIEHTDENIFNKITQLEQTDKIRLLRDFVIKHVRQCAGQGSSIHSQLFVKFALAHNEKETNNAFLKYDDLCKKRQQTVQSKIDQIQQIMQEQTAQEEQEA